MTARRRLWPAVLAASIAFLILVGLGVWQVERLHWKEALLARIAERADAAPVPLAEAEGRRSAGEDIDYLVVTARGVFAHDQEKFMLSGLEGNPAWEVITPLITDDNRLLLVDRGIVPDTRKDPNTRADGNKPGEVEVTGILRAHAAPPGFFVPENDPKAGQWFWWDVPALLAATPVAAGASPLPFVLHVTPQLTDAGYPRPQAPATGIVNNHLQYALTWFGLAAVLVVIAGLYVREQMKKPGA